MYRELDAKVAEAWGWQETKEFRKAKYGPGYSYWTDQYGYVACLPPFSTDIAAAWELVGWMQAAWHLNVNIEALADKRDYTCAVLNYLDLIDGKKADVSGNTVMEAICKAFLAVTSPPPPPT